MDNNNKNIIVLPWVRLGARVIDITLYSIFIFLLLLATGKIQSLDFGLTYFLTGIVGVFIEAQMLSTWGTTPGKWLLSIVVRDKDFMLLSFLQALKRTALMWLFGMAMCLNFTLMMLPITAYLAYMELINMKMTLWDRITTTRTIHLKFGNAKLVVGLLLIAIGIALPFIFAAILSLILKQI